MKLSSWERIETLLDWAGLNCHSLAAHIGLDSAQSLYQIRAGKHGISRMLAQKICLHYPELSYSWLLTGEGEMIKPRHRPLPCYTCDCRDVVLSTERYGVPDSYVVLPDCGEATFAAYMRSERMAPIIPNGALLVCRSCHPSELKEGELCLIAYGRDAAVGRFVGQDEWNIHLVDGRDTRVEIERTLIAEAYSIRAVINYTNH